MGLGISGGRLIQVQPAPLRPHLTGRSEDRAHGASADSDKRFLNREYSWLDFNARVLALAEDESMPVLERLKFCAIFSSNLDEFFQVRVAGLLDQVAGDVSRLTPDGRLPLEQLIGIRQQVEALCARRDNLFVHTIVPQLHEAGVHLVSWDELDAAGREYFIGEFNQRMFPVLTPLAVDPSHPFPYISNLSLSLAVVLRSPSGSPHIARVKVPPLFRRFWSLPNGHTLVPVEEIIASQIGVLFPGVEVESVHPFRLTRNADLTFEGEEEADDLLAVVETELRRGRFKHAVRLELSRDMPDEVAALLADELELGAEQIYVHDGPLGLHDLWGVYALDLADLKLPYLPPSPVPALAALSNDGIFGALRQGDVLVHHPYNSFGATVEEFLHEAAADPRVLAIKMTLYRLSGDSPIADALVRAAERGKQVAVVIELKARFDELANIEWAKRLEEAGIHVVYGVIGLKTHAKAILVVREDTDGLRRYCHIGTGNYNSRTARTYEDLGIFTIDPAIADDLTRLFNSLTGVAHEAVFERVLVAPHALRPALLELIEGERSLGAGRGRIVMRMNSLVDAALIEALYAASCGGVQIDLIIRGICCLRPGVPGQSENIRVRSILGRYLEHSRVYHFANGAGVGKPAWYLGSADLMPRNLDRRVEMLVPMQDRAVCERLDEVFAVNLEDDTLAWVLHSDGTWEPIESELGGTVDTHLRLHWLAEQRARA